MIVIPCFLFLLLFQVCISYPPKKIQVFRGSICIHVSYLVLFTTTIKAMCIMKLSMVKLNYYGMGRIFHQQRRLFRIYRLRIPTFIIPTYNVLFFSNCRYTVWGSVFGFQQFQPLAPGGAKGLHGTRRSFQSFMWSLSWKFQIPEVILLPHCLTWGVTR